MTKKNAQETRDKAIPKQAAKDEAVKSALVIYRREQEAVAKRTAELRALRLAHEAKTGPKKTPGKRAAKSAPKGSLSDWLDDQNKSGRNN